MADGPGSFSLRRLSIVVPAKDEARRLRASLEHLVSFSSTQPYAVEIIVVDDGSTDATAEIARDAARALEARGSSNVTLRLLQHERNRGKGGAVRTGALAASGDAILSFDADMAMPPEDASKLLAALAAGADVAAGSRIQPGGRDLRASQPAWRRIGGRIFAMTRRSLLLPDIEDTQCGFKAFRREAAGDLFARQRLDGWAFDAELLYLARRLGYRIEQVPITWRHVEDSQFKLSLRSALREIGDLLRIRWMHRHASREGEARST